MTRADLVQRLRDTSEMMASAAGLLSFYGAVSVYAVQYSEELAGAAEMVGEWADELEKEENKVNLDLISADRARCNGNGSSCCETCSRRLQTLLDKYSAGIYPHVDAMATNGQCIFKIDAEKWKP